MMLAPGPKPNLPLPLRLALRELRGGLRGFGVFIACIALGVLAIAGVGSMAKSLADGLSSAGSVILGGDLAFSLVQREASQAERAFLGANGTVSGIAILPTMARTTDGRTTLVELKAVDDLCRSRAGHCSRNTWIVEAVAEKLAREHRGGSRGSNA